LTHCLGASRPFGWQIGDQKRGQQPGRMG